MLSELLLIGNQYNLIVCWTHSYWHETSITWLVAEHIITDMVPTHFYDMWYTWQRFNTLPRSECTASWSHCTGLCFWGEILQENGDIILRVGFEHTIPPLWSLRYNHYVTTVLWPCRFAEAYMYAYMYGHLLPFNDCLILHSLPAHVEAQLRWKHIPGCSTFQDVAHSRM